MRAATTSRISSDAPAVVTTPGAAESEAVESLRWLGSIVAERRTALIELVGRISGLESRALRLGLTAEVRRAISAENALAHSIDDAVQHGAFPASASSTELADAVRTAQARHAALMVASDWHSPPIRSSVPDAAGKYTGAVTAHHDDYKRDRHPDAARWERAWIGEMVDNPRRLPVRAFMTSSGMAAVTTVLELIASDHPDSVWLGGRVYHETRDLVLARFGHRARVFDESDRATWGFASTAARHAIVVDARTNTSTPTTLDLPALAAAAGATSRIVIDTTALSVASQPMSLATRARIVTVESLTKYPQCGLDIAAGGVIVTSATPDGRMVDELREHLGTNIADIVTHLHPRPNRSRLDARLRRIGRNARHLLSALRADCPADWTFIGPNSSSDFDGGIVVAKGPSTDALVRACEATLRGAAHAGLVIHDGTSFGFDATRLYLVPGTARSAEPYVRIAAGTETIHQVQALGAVLTRAFR